MKIVNKIVFKRVNTKSLVFKIVNCKIFNLSAVVDSKLKNYGNI